MALDGFKRGQFQVLVATDIVARGIDVEELSHVVNFDVPNVPDDYIHRVGRTARAEATGDAFTFVSPDEEPDLRAIERAVGRSLPRITVSGFDYAQKAAERFEVPIGERIAAIRARRAEERKRAKEKAERRAGRSATPPSAKPAGRPESKAEHRPTREERPKPAPRPASAAPKSGARERIRGAWSPERSASPAPRSRHGETPRPRNPRTDTTPAAEARGGGRRRRRRRGGGPRQGGA
jgi:ATP-dependent RNA helicase RhlE